MPDKMVKQHSFIFNEHDNGGEQLILTTQFYDNGDKEKNIYMNHQLSLNSYGNSAVFNLSGTLTPDVLRKLAGELEYIWHELMRKGKDWSQYLDNLEKACDTTHV